MDKKPFKIGRLKKILFSLIGYLFRTYRYFVPTLFQKNKILIIDLNKIGDTILTFPAIKEIVDRYGEDVSVLSYSDTKILFDLFLSPKMVVSVDKQDFIFKGRIPSKKVRNVINKINPEIIIDFTGSIISISLLFNLNAREIYGTTTDYYRSLFGNEYLLYNNTSHLLDRYSEVSANLLKQPLSKKYYEYPINIEKVERVLIHPLAGWKAKEWGLSNFIKLAKELNKDYKVFFIFEKGLLANDTLNLLDENKTAYIETESLEQLINEIRKCSFFIGNDSGPIHIANILGKPTFTIFGPTNPNYIQPFGKYHRHINIILECSPLNELYCLTNAGRSGCPAFLCLDDLEFDRVYDAIANHLSNISAMMKLNEN